MKRTEPFAFVRDLATRWDAVALVIVLGLLVALGEASRGLFEPLAKLKATPISLDPWQLPFYAARTTLRMFAALGVSLVFTFTYATWAAKSPRAGKLLVPILDILQSVPILSFISITVVFFMSLAPGRVVGAEFAAIFAIFTSQAWNMAFSFYQSLRTVPGIARGGPLLPSHRLDDVLAGRGALRPARSDLEHHDVHVGRLVFRGGLRGTAPRPHLAGPTRHRFYIATAQEQGNLTPSDGRSPPCSS